MTKFKGFTLAEVLITLGIIGVVAAMTMPTLINSTQGAQYKTAYKKALSVMSQAIVMNIALDDYDLSQTVAGTNGDEASHGVVTGGGTDGGDRAAETQTIYTLFKNRMNVVKVSGQDDLAETYKVIDAGDATDIPEAGHFGGTGTDGTTAGTGAWTALAVGELPDDFTYMFFNDGIVFMFDNTQANCHAATNVQTDAYCSGWIDVNGEKGPNKVVRCDTGTLELVDSIINKERWDLISRCMTLDQKFLHKYAHKINWSLLVSNAKTILTEEQIEEFYHYIPTRRLIYSKSLYTLSDDFIIKHINEFSYNDMIHIIQKKVFSNEFYVEYANYYDIDVLDIHAHIPMEAVDFHLTHAIVTNKGKALRICMPCEVGEKRQHMTEEYASLILKHADKLKWSDIPEEARKEASIYFWFSFHHRKFFGNSSN